MKKYFLLVAIIFLSACSAQKHESFVMINEGKIKVEIAKTYEEKYNGLSNRENLCENCGMLFIFNEKNKQKFVMRDMNFPLDIIWINDNEIIKIDKNLQPEGSNPINLYNSEAPVNYVLEVNVGFSDKYNIRAGNKINYNL